MFVVCSMQIFTMLEILIDYPFISAIKIDLRRKRDFKNQCDILKILKKLSYK